MQACLVFGGRPKSPSKFTAPDAPVIDYTTNHYVHDFLNPIAVTRRERV